MENKKLYAFYGSLRRGMENYKLYEKGLKFLRKHELRGFKMFSLGDFPYVCKTANIGHKIVVELFEITDQETEESIHRLESEVGYILEEVEIAKQKFGIYLYAESAASDKEIVSGDWVEFTNALRF